jgi:hypothetical protein
MSLTTGREGAGWPKALGRFPAPDPLALPFHLSAYGLADFGPASRPGWTELLRIEPDGDHGIDDLAAGAGLAVELLRAADRAFGVDGVEAVQSLVGCLGRRVLPQLFAKRIAAASDQAGDELTQAVAARARVTGWGPVELLGPARLTVHDLAGHAVARDLGLTSQDLPVGLRVRLDFVQESGRVLWSSHRR